MSRSISENAEHAKRSIKEIRLGVMSSVNTAIKDLDLKRRAESAIQNLHSSMVKKIEEQVVLKQKEMNQ